MGKLRFFNDRRGSIVLPVAIAFPVLIGAVGVSVDYSRLHSAQTELQSINDTATLAAAREHTTNAQSTTFQNYLTAQVSKGKFFVSNSLTSSLTPSSTTLTGKASATVDLMIADAIGFASGTVSATSVVNLEQTQPTEISLVLDVSSSMIEQGRFAPMQTAAGAFVDTVTNSTSGLKNWKIAVTPFSSRINFGIQNTSFRKAWNSNPVTPTRWTNPTATYSTSSYSKNYWIDSTNFYMYNGKNYYWMGCVEPRKDFDIHAKTSTSYALSEQPPSKEQFVPQDDNSLSGFSFCPPPILPLSNSASTVKSAISNLTSQGSTRLDVGMLGGWYTLSPSWATSWASASAPAAYGSTRKFVVFMTDGQMNTQDDPNSSHYDWLCESTSTCDSTAYSDLLSTCNAMKAQGITIFTIAYDNDADINNMKACSSGNGYFFQASSTSSDNTAIKSVYSAIAQLILVPPRLIQ